MTKILITHANGFMGSHLIDRLLNERPESQIVGLYSPRTPTLKNLKHLENLESKIDLKEITCLDASMIKAAVNEVGPDLIFHFERFTRPGQAWENPEDAFTLNVQATINLLAAVAQARLKPRIVIESSAAIYGHVTPADLPLKESAALHLNEKSGPYEWSVVAQEAFARKFILAHGLDIILGRSFNIEGPRRRTSFVTSDFAAQIAKLERENADRPTIKVGNLSARRDWTDVRDAVSAYLLLAEKGIKGEVYNVGSGIIKSINEILTSLIGYSNLKNCQIVADPDKMRPTDIPMLQADYHKLKEATGWEPKISYGQMIKDVLDDWRRRVREDEYDK